MATLEQLSAALVKADAAGNTADAKVFADALRAMKAQQPAPVAAPPAAVPSAPAASSPNLWDSTLATVNGLTSSVPFLQETSDALVAGGQSLGDMATGQPVDFGKRYGSIREGRERVAAKAPLANMAGQFGGLLAAPAALATTKLGAEALGMTGTFGKQLLNSGLSTAAYEGVSGLSKGHTGGQLLGDMGVGFAGGGAGALVGKAVEKGGQVVADALTKGAQSKLTNAALKTGAQDAASLRAESRGYFGNSVDENPIMLKGDAYKRFLGGVEASTKKFRPNELNNPEAVGLLRKLYDVAAQIDAPGSNVAVDLKDLHILRQAAQEVAQTAKSDQSQTIARQVVSQMDSFIQSLRTGDTLGGGDPREAANNLLMGISTWARASKVKTIEKAIADADTYKSGVENGLKLSFLKLMRTDDFARMSKVEQEAIRTVAKGTTRQNIAEGLGKLGFSLGSGSAHNILGGTAGTGLLTAGLTPFVGPFALPAALATTTAVGAAGRKIAEEMGTSGANRAAQIAATQGIKIAAQRPNLLGPLAVPASLMVRAGAEMSR